MQSHASMDIDSWIVDKRAQSDLSGGQPPSIGDVRQMDVSQPTCSDQMYSDGQPPSVNDVRKPEPSQSEASCTRYDYEGPDAHEVQQPRISEINLELRLAIAGTLVNSPAAGTHGAYFPLGYHEQVYKTGAVGRSIDMNAYSRYTELKRDLKFGSKVSQSFEIPHMTFNSTDSSLHDGGILYGGIWAPPPQPFQRIGTYIMVYKSGAIGRSVDISKYSGYQELKQDLARIFGIEGQLDDQQRIGWKFFFVDRDGDILIVGDDPWQEFVDCVSCIKILSTQELQQMSLDGDFVGNSALPNQATGVEQFNDHISLQL